MDDRKRGMWMSTGAARERKHLESAAPGQPGHGAGTGGTMSPSVRLLLAAPVVFFLLLLIGTVILSNGGSYEPPFVLFLLNLLFLTAIPFGVAAVVSLAFLRSGTLTLLLLGCGMVSLGTGSLLGGLAVHRDPNVTVTLHNTGSLLSALFLFSCTLLSFTHTGSGLATARRGVKLTAAYLAIAAGGVLLYWGSSAALTPPFFIQGTGPTPLRQTILGGALLFFTLSTILSGLLYLRERHLFFPLYAIGLALMTIGLYAVFIQKAVGSPVGWVGRGAQYGAMLYFLAAAVVVLRERIATDRSFASILGGFFSNYLKEQVLVRTAALEEVTAALEARETLLGLLADNVSDVIWVLDLETMRFLYVSPSVERLRGYTPEEALAQDAAAALTAESLRYIRQVIPERVRALDRERTGPSYRDEIGQPHRDGSTVWTEVTTRYRLNPKNGHVEVYGVSRDISERRQAEQVLIEAAREWSTSFDAMSDGVSILGADRTILRANRALCRMLGKREEEIVGQKCFRIFHGGEHPVDRCPVQTTRETLAEGHAEFFEPTLDRWLSVSTAPVLDGAGRLLRIVHVARDITDRIRSQEALEEKTRLVQTFIDALPCTALLLDRNRVVVLPNKSAREVGAAVGTQCFYTWGQRLEPCPWCLAPAALTTGTEQHLVVEALGTVWDAHWIPVGPDLYLHYAFDITDRKRLEERLHRAEKMEALGMLAGGVAHDLNNVLGVLFVYTELLRDMVPAGGPLQTYADQILSSGEKGAAIVQDLLTLARRSVPVYGVLNLNAVIADFLRTPVYEKLQAGRPAVSFRTELSPELLNVRGSALHLEKTVMNLIANAAESITDGGRVTVRTENRYLDRPVHGYDAVQEGDYAVLAVSDTGEGISTEDIGKIFEPFYTKKVMGRSGTGLGLAIVWGTVKDHSGYIDVQSEAGTGTTFTLYFPVTREEAPEAPHKVPVEQYLGRGESILVVDDSPEQRDVAERLLERLGYTVHLAAGGEEAVEFLRGRSVDLVLLDMIMDPGIDGLETYRRIAALHPGQRAIIVSGFAETEQVRTAQELGAGAYVRKPYLMEKIGTAIREELRKGQS